MHVRHHTRRVPSAATCAQPLMNVHVCVHDHTRVCTCVRSLLCVHVGGRARTAMHRPANHASHTGRAHVVGRCRAYGTCAHTRMHWCRRTGTHTGGHAHGQSGVWVGTHTGGHTIADGRVGSTRVLGHTSATGARGCMAKGLWAGTGGGRAGMTLNTCGCMAGCTRGWACGRAHVGGHTWRRFVARVCTRAGGRSCGHAHVRVGTRACWWDHTRVGW